MKYNGFNIKIKEDFGGRPFLIDGMPCMHGYVVTDGICNVMPGATWFQTVSDAKVAIDIYRITGNTPKFWELMRESEAAVAMTIARFLQDKAHPAIGSY